MSKGRVGEVVTNSNRLPAAAWEPAIAALQADESCPAMLTYDRYGQGKTLSQDVNMSSSPLLRLLSKEKRPEHADPDSRAT